jgi:CheY-like chemotaxis protein
MLRAPEDLLVEHTTLVGFSILVLEPNPGAAQYIRRPLEGAGAQVFPTSSRKQALLIIEKGELSAAVLDYNESATDDHATARHLAKIGIVFLFCMDVGRDEVQLGAPVPFRPIVGEKLIGTLRGLLQGNCSRPGELTEDVADPKRTSFA